MMSSLGLTLGRDVMLLRVFIFLQVVAAALIGLTAYWDGAGIPVGLIRTVFCLGIGCVYLLPAFPIVLFMLLWSSKIDSRQKLYAGIVGFCAWIAQLIAALPLVQ